MTLALTALAVMGLTACGETPAEPETEAASPEPSTAPGAAEAQAADASAAPAATAETLPDPVAVSPGAPAFAVIYPGGVLAEDGVQSDGSAGPGGIVTFTTSAAPDDIVAFYRTRAEGEGLASVMAMNQGQARAYGAHSTSTGANLSVVASPLEDGGASVQLVWSAGG